VSSNGATVNKIVCLGSPARYQQRPSQDKELVLAKANRIEYRLAVETIILLEKASLEQSAGIIRGERIEYDLKNEIVNAKGSSTGNQRIQMVIPAQTSEKQPDDAQQPGGEQ